MLERKLVRQPGRGTPHDRSLEATLQRTPAAQLAWLLATQCFCHLPEKAKTHHTHWRLTLGANLIRGEGRLGSYWLQTATAMQAADHGQAQGDNIVIDWSMEQHGHRAPLGD